MINRESSLNSQLSISYQPIINQLLINHQFNHELSLDSIINFLSVNDQAISN